MRPDGGLIDQGFSTPEMRGVSYLRPFSQGTSFVDLYGSSVARVAIRGRLGFC